MYGVYSPSKTAVNFGGLKFRVILDGAAEYFSGRILGVVGGASVNATDLRNGNYSVVLPSQWSSAIGKHRVHVEADGQLIPWYTGHSVSLVGMFGMSALTPVMQDAIKLTVLPIVCAKGTNTIASNEGQTCVCQPGYGRVSGQCLLCPAGTMTEEHARKIRELDNRDRKIRPPS